MTKPFQLILLTINIFNYLILFMTIIDENRNFTILIYCKKNLTTMHFLDLTFDENYQNTFKDH